MRLYPTLFIAITTNILGLYSFPMTAIASERLMPYPPQPVILGLAAAEVGQIAKGVTVRLVSEVGAGSGVIIQRNDTTYTVLTAAHVLTAAGASYQVLTPEGQIHLVLPRSITPLPGVDLALVQFQSSQTYPVAQLGDSSQSSEGSTNYVAGFPAKTQAITEAIYNFTEGKLTANASRPLADGYALVYTNSTLPGMSGGPVFNSEGQLVGIHGRADTTEQVQNADLAPNIYIKTGFNLGIPINTFLRLVPQTALGTSLNLADAPPKTLTPQPTADDFFLQGQSKFENRDDAGAIAAYTEAIRLKPDYGAAYVERGFAHLWSGNGEAALADVNRALELEPQNSAAYLARGGIYLLLLRDNQQARLSYEQAQTLASAQGDPIIARKAQAVIDVLQTQAPQPFTELAIALYRTQIFFGTRNTQLATAELQRIETMLCAEKNEKIYMIGRLKARTMLLPVQQKLPVEPTRCSAVQSKAQPLSATLDQAIAAFPPQQFDAQYAHYLRGLLRAEILGDRSGAIDDFKIAVANPWPSDKAEDYREAQRYLKSLQ